MTYIYGPQTLEEAKAWRYGKWGGNPQGKACVPGMCIASVTDHFTSIGHQCYRPIAKQVSDRYCKQHARMAGQIGPEA